MNFRIEKYLLKKADELAFITIKNDGDFKLEGYKLPNQGLDVPIKNEVLVKGIKETTGDNSSSDKTDTDKSDNDSDGSTDTDNSTAKTE